MNDQHETGMIGYVSFLRGLNLIGGNRILRGELHAVFNRMGFRDVYTYMDSGNLRYSSDIKNDDVISSLIESNLYKNFGQEIQVITRPYDYLEKLAERNPFGKYSKLKDGHFYISFLQQPAKLTLKLPYRNQEGSLEIPLSTKREIFCVVRPGMDHLEQDAIISIENLIGRDSATRKWETVLKILSE